MDDLVIRGMNMPKSCDECRLFNESWCMALSVENWRKSYNKPPEGGRLPDCPLVPRRDGRMFRKLIHRIRKRRFCKANHWFCPDCIYHEHLFDGIVYRGVRCHYPTEGGGEE